MPKSKLSLPIKRLMAMLFAFSLVAAACGSDSNTAADDTGSGDAASEDAGSDDASGEAACGTGATTVGFLYVGPKDDFGYNQAAYEAAVAMGEATGVEVIHAENVPETVEDAVPVMEDMIAQGATILFPTSFGHFLPAAEVAANNPGVCVVHQGQLESSLESGPLDNLGTYFASVFEPVYLAGISAGAVTETNTLGYVYAFPIPQTLQNINAFTLGAQSVNPDATVIAVSTADWCDPAKQAQAAQTLLDQGADVLTQHQDCTKTVIETAEAAGAYSVGYHYDASELAPEGWLTGSDWAWTDLYSDIVSTMVAGDFVDSPYNGDYKIGYQDADAPFVAFVPSAFGPAVDAETQALVADALAMFTSDEDGDGVGDFNIFAGPIEDRDGTVQIEDGVLPTYIELDQLMGFGSWFVPGVEGSLE